MPVGEAERTAKVNLAGDLDLVGGVSAAPGLIGLKGEAAMPPGNDDGS